MKCMRMFTFHKHDQYNHPLILINSCPGADFASSVYHALDRHVGDIQSVSLFLSYPYDVEQTQTILWIQAMEARKGQNSW